MCLRTLNGPYKHTLLGRGGSLCRGSSCPPSPATNSQDRVRLTITTLAEHRPSGSDADPFANEGRGTPRDTTEGLDKMHGQTTPRSLPHVFCVFCVWHRAGPRPSRSSAYPLPLLSARSLGKKKERKHTPKRGMGEQRALGALGLGVQSSQPHIQGRGAKERTQRAG